MTPTIDDVIRRITEDLNEQIKSVVIQEKTIKVIIYKYLKALQLPPSQHLKDETKQCTACLWHKTHSKYTASKGTIEVNCSRCNGTGLETVYDEKPKTYTFEQMEAEYDRWFTNWLLAIGGKKEELKQSTPKIERIDRVTKHEIDASTIHKRVKTKDIEATIQLILDKINSLDQ